MIMFVSIFGAGFLILILSFIFGADADHDLAVDDLDGGGPAILSLKMISLLMIGFGAAGFGVRATSDWGMLAASLAGLVGAAAVGGAGYVILRLFHTSQVTSTIGDSDVVGMNANLIDAIARDGYGQVACIIRGREITFLARSADGGEIPRNTPIKIIGKTGNVVTVEKL